MIELSRLACLLGALLLRILPSGLKCIDGSGSAATAKAGGTAPEPYEPRSALAGCLLPLQSKSRSRLSLRPPLCSHDHSTRLSPARSFISIRFASHPRLSSPHSFSSFIAMLFSNVVAILALTASAYAQNGTSAAAPASSAASSSSSSSVAPSSVASAAPSSASASSNFTLPAGATTASWPAGLVLQSSVPYTMPPALNVATLGQAAIDYRLANMSESYRQSLCDRQTQWCTTAGCVEAGATINDNFCDVNK